MNFEEAFFDELEKVSSRYRLTTIGMKELLKHLLPYKGVAEAIEGMPHDRKVLRQALKESGIDLLARKKELGESYGLIDAGMRATKGLLE
jgi:hypothetical protein